MALRSPLPTALTGCLLVLSGECGATRTLRGWVERINLQQGEKPCTNDATDVPPQSAQAGDVVKGFKAGQRHPSMDLLSVHLQVTSSGRDVTGSAGSP